jgi:hypothetical protein
MNLSRQQRSVSTNGVGTSVDYLIAKKQFGQGEY